MNTTPKQRKFNIFCSYMQQKDASLQPMRLFFDKLVGQLPNEIQNYFTICFETSLPRTTI